MNKINVSKIPVINADVEFKYLEKETFILFVETGQFFKLDEVGTNIWKFINGKRTINEIVQELNKKYDTEIIRLKRDVIEFIKKGLKLRILSTKNKI